MYVDSARVQFSYVLQPAEEGADLFPGDGRKRTAVEMFLDPLDVGLQIRNIGEFGEQDDTRYREGIYAG